MGDVSFRLTDMSAEGVELAWSGEGFVYPWVGWKRLSASDGRNEVDLQFGPNDTTPRETYEELLRDNLLARKK